MISGARTATARSRLYRSGWLVFVLALASYLFVAVAEQGGVGAGLREVPEEPIPFSNHSGIGIDLSGMSSLAALEWLEQGSVEGTPMLVLPVDGDIVAAFNDPETLGAARSAIDSLVAASGDTPLTLCLRKPVSAVEEPVLAEAILTVIVEDYTDSVAYLSTCAGETSDTWESNVLEILGTEPTGGADERLMAPVSVGAPIRLQDAIDPEELTGEYVDTLADASYVAVDINADLPLSESLRDEVGKVLRQRAHIALVLARPPSNVPPQDFAATTRLDNVAPSELAEGYNDITTPAMRFQGEWTPTQVGPVLYQRTSQTGAALSADFVGTEIWAVGLVSPGAGRIGIWIDADEPVTNRDPDQIIDLADDQAINTSVLLIDNLPAAAHRITIVASEGEVTLAGLFVTGRPEAGWHGGLGALGIIATAMAGMAVVISVAVDDLRLRMGLDRTDDQEAEHPRIFRREL